METHAISISFAKFTSLTRSRRKLGRVNSFQFRPRVFTPVLRLKPFPIRCISASDDHNHHDQNHHHHDHNHNCHHHHHGHDCAELSAPQKATKTNLPLLSLSPLCIFSNGRNNSSSSQNPNSPHFLILNPSFPPPHSFSSSNNNLKTPQQQHTPTQTPNVPNKPILLCSVFRQCSSGRIQLRQCGTNGNAVPAEFSSYSHDANNIRSGFTSYAESGNGANDSFKAYGNSGNTPHNNFKSYGVGAHSGIDKFTSYLDGANSGDDTFQSYSSNSHSGEVDFANYGRTYSLVPKPAVKLLQNSFLFVAFPLVGVTHFSA